MSQSSQREGFFEPSKVTKKDLYTCLHTKSIFSLLLLRFAYRQFKVTHVIKNIDFLKAFVHANPKPPFSEVQDRLAPLMFEGVIDLIRICICFENYFKAQLLLKGFLVHEIKDRNSLLWKAQKTRPISAQELPTTLDNHEIQYDSLLREQTLQFSLMLREKDYFQHFALVETDLAFLTTLNQKRNSLHLYAEDGIRISKRIIDGYEQLNAIVDDDVVRLHNSLLDIVDPHNVKGWKIFPCSNSANAKS